MHLLEEPVVLEVAVAKDENSRKPVAFCPRENTQRTQTTSKRFEEVKSRAHTRNFRGLFD